MTDSASTRTVITKRPPFQKSSMSFTDQDRLAADKIIEAGWATNFTGAVRFALKFASEQVAPK